MLKLICNGKVQNTATKPRSGFNLAKTTICLIGLYLIFTPKVFADTTYLTLYDALHDSETSTRTYTLDTDEAVTQDLGTMEGIELTINGGNYSINGTTNPYPKGINVLSGQTLNINDILLMSLFNTPINNTGTVNLSNCTFRENKNVSLYNDGIINFKNKNNISYLMGSGTANIASGANVSFVRLTQDNLINRGTLVTDVVYLNIKNGITNTGTLNLTGSTDPDNPAVLTENNKITGSGTTYFLGGSENYHYYTSNAEITQNYVFVSKGSDKVIFTSNKPITVSIELIVRYGGILYNNSDIIGNMVFHSNSAVYSNADNLKGNISSYGSICMTGGTYSYVLKGIDEWVGGLYIAGDTTNAGSITTQTLNIKTDKTLTNNASSDITTTSLTNVGNIINTGTFTVSTAFNNTGSVENNGVMKIGSDKTTSATARTLGSITGSGTLELTGGFHVVSNTISQDALVLDSGVILQNQFSTYTIIKDMVISPKSGYQGYADALIVQNGIQNNGSLNLFGGILSSDVTGSGSILVNSEYPVIFNSSITGNNLNMQSGTAKLGTNADLNVNNLTVLDNSYPHILDTQNTKIDTIAVQNITLNKDLGYSLDVDLLSKSADKISLSGSLAETSHQVVIQDINLMSHGKHSVTVNLTDNTDLAGVITAQDDNWKSVTHYSDGTAYTGRSISYNPATGDLRFINFDLSTGTIDRMTAKSEAYLDSAHDVISLSATETGYNSSVKIDGATYYFNTDNENLKTLVTSGSNALKETVSTDSTAVFTYGGKYYTYDYDKLPISAYETSVVENPESGADYNYSSADSEGNKTYYNIDIPTYRLGKSDNIDWEIVEASEAIADTETGKLKSGYIVIRLTKADGSPDYRYYKYVYTGRRNNDSSLGASLKALRQEGTKALGNGSADEKDVKSTSEGKETASQTYKRVMQEQQMEFVRAAAYGSKNHPKPCVLSAPIAAQVGGYLTQVNSYDQAFANLDMEMMNSGWERALGQEGTSALGNGSADETGKGLWTRPYATFERVHLTSGPTVGNIAYGNFFGGDMGKKELRNGWKRQFSAYIGYNGSTQDFDRQSIDQNGGTLGVMETWYKGNFFTALTANVSGNFADANTDIGKERMAMIMAGIASKTGYNIEFAKGKFIIQPSILLSYSFVHTFAHNNCLGSRVHSSPLNAIQVAPGIKFIANLKNGWQPYLGVNMRWNIIDKTSFNIREVNIPDMSIRPYVEYGIGLQKRWGERFTGYFQTMLRNGARNGVMLSLGLRWAIGK